jgi:hypothetical protein
MDENFLRGISREYLIDTSAGKEDPKKRKTNKKSFLKIVIFSIMGTMLIYKFSYIRPLPAYLKLLILFNAGLITTFALYEIAREERLY